MGLRESWHGKFGRRVASAALPDSGFRGRIELVDPLPPFAIGDRKAIPIAVVNESPSAWPSTGDHRIGVGYWWRKPGDLDTGIEGALTPLRRDLAAGASQRLAPTVRAPNTPGEYWLELDLIQQGVSRFAAKDGQPLRVSCPVIGIAPADFGGYEDAWAKADLGRDYWSIVGPASEAEFRKLSQIKLKLLIDRGLTASGRVLDVGCGTGLLACALAEFLDERGRYCGTDLSEKAVEFCRRKYARPNFAFAKNEMTSLPIREDRGFDVIAFFSVFTHTYAEETDLLLAEAERLLADPGIILADCFFSPSVADQSGNRAMMVLGEQRFQAILAQRGLRSVLIDESFWDGTVRRPMLEITRR
jgi:SAM-dependent methyltransferase